MRTQSSDTSPEFERVQIARIRTFSLAKKFRSVRSWTQSITTANLYATHGSTCDLQVIKHQAGTLDIKYLRQLAPLVGVADSLERAIADAGIQTN